MTLSPSEKPNIFRRIPAGAWVFFAAFFCQFSLVMFSLSESRHFLPDGDDMKFYNDWSLKILGDLQWKKGEANEPGTAFYGLPGYAYALAGIHRATGGYSHEYSPFIVAQIQAVFHALTATWLFLLARKIVAGRAGTVLGIIAAAAWVAYTPGQIFSAILMPTSWVVCAFWGLVYWLVCIHEKGAASWWRPWLWIGLAAGAMAMMVATILMLLPLVIVTAALTVQRGQRLLRRLAHTALAASVLLGGVYAGCSPAWIHNHFFAHDPVLLSAHDGLNFYLGNNATATGYTRIPPGLRASQEGLLTDSLRIPEREMGRPLKRSEASAYWKEKGRAYIRDNPAAWMRLLGVKIEKFWNAYQYDDLSILKLLRDEGTVPPGLRFGFIAVLALPGLLLCAWRLPRSRWVIAAVLLHMASLLPVFITERYRLAAVPGLILLAVLGLGVLWKALATRRLITATIYLALLAAAAWWVTIPQADTALWSLDFYKAGIRSTDGAIEAKARAATARALTAEMRKTGNTTQAAQIESRTADYDRAAAEYLDRAQRNLETAFAFVQTNPEICFALGNVWYQRDDRARADTCWRLALAIEPRHDRALNNLGVIAIDEKRWPDAEKLIRSSLTIEPDDARAWWQYAAVLKELGDLARAEKAIDRAIALDPKNEAFAKFRAALQSPTPPQ